MGTRAVNKHDGGKRPRTIRHGERARQLVRPDRHAKLRKRWVNGEEFSIRDAAHLLKLSPSSTLRLMNELRDAGTLLREGKGSTVRYRFVVKTTTLLKATQ